MRRTQVAVWAACLPAFAVVVATAQSRPETQSSSTTQSHNITVTGCLQGPAPSTTGTAGQSPAAKPTPSSGSGGQFVLTNAMMGSASPSSSGTSKDAVPGNTGTTGNTSAGAPPATSRGTEAGGASSVGTRGSEHMSYVLEGSHDELARHVGHRIEVTGAAEPAMPKTGASAGASAERNSAEAGSAAGQAKTGATSPDASSSQHADSSDSQHTDGRHAQPHLRVASVRMISSNCSQ